MHNAQGDIIARIREALRNDPADPSVRASACHARRRVGDLMPPAPRDHAGRIMQFREHCAQLTADFVEVSGRDAMCECVSRIIERESPERVATHRAQLTDQCAAAISGQGVDLLHIEDRPAKAELAACAIGITTCEALIAQTGSVLVTSIANGGRALSVLPPHHIVLATAGQMVGTLADGYALLRERYADTWPSMMSLITGPSRTGDIERILVLGAHGPRALTIVFDNEAG